MNFYIINESELRANFDGDEDILADLIEEFIKKYPLIMNDLQTSIEDKKFESIKLHSHTLKGVVSNFFAESVRLKFYDIEQAASKHLEADYKNMLNVASDELEKLVEELKELKSTL